MSESKEGEKVVGGEGVKNVKVESKVYSNPALRMMGLPVIRLPSRNWMIFWTVLAFGAGGIIYDKYEQRKIRQKWMDRVAKYGEKPLKPNELARKVTVYIAPPPSDYLDESVAVFRKYVKPILNSAGVDYQIQSEDRQGVIRSVVSAEIRSLRREIIKNEQELRRIENESRWYNKLKNLFKKKDESEKELLLNKKFTDDLNFKEVLGVYYKNIHKADEVISEESSITEPNMQGGVICIGRGAYKEYLHGLHEGLLGPIDKPIAHKEFEDIPKEELKEALEVIEPPKVLDLNEINENDKNEPIEKDGVKVEDLEGELSKPKLGTEEEEEQQTEVTKAPIPKPFISTDEYSNSKIAPEFEFNGKIPTNNKVSPFFQQPILVIPVHHLLGFLKTPQRIYRFYNKRLLTEEYGRATVALVENLQSPFSLNDVDLAKAEEDDWPKKWVDKGLEKGSEWTSPLVTDERVLSKLKLYDADRVLEIKK